MKKFDFKKTVLASATAAAVAGGAGIANAVVLGVPGEAVLVPYVTYSSAESTNTLIGITAVDGRAIGGPGGPGTAPAPNGGYLPSNGVHTFTCNTVATDGFNDGDDLHWYFFNSRSVHLLDDGFNATHNDFIGFDWRNTAEALGAAAIAATDGVLGYMVFATEAAKSGLSSADLCMFADAMVIEGNWQSAAYIPTFAMADAVDDPAGVLASGIDEVNYGGQNFPALVNPLTTGMTVDDGLDGTETVVWDMRYFLPTSGGVTGETDLVVWLSNNYDGSPTGERNLSNVGVEVFDTAEQSNSANVDLSSELNVLDASLIPGARTGSPDGDGVTDDGFIWFKVTEIPSADVVPGIDPTNNAAVTFSLIRLQSGGNPEQVQTILGHERGIGAPLD